MLGRLCRLMRMCGFDTAYCDRGIEILAIARKEDRVILTRNTKLSGKPHIHFIETDDPEQQLSEVMELFQMHDHIAVLSRCLECNQPLKPVNKTRIRNRVPFYTYMHNDIFSACPKCQRVYWPGSHHKNMIARLSQLKTTGEDIK